MNEKWIPLREKERDQQEEEKNLQGKTDRAQ